MKKRKDSEVKQININKTKLGFKIEIIYTDSKVATFSSDGYELKWVFDSIRRQLDG